MGRERPEDPTGMRRRVGVVGPCPDPGTSRTTPSLYVRLDIGRSFDRNYISLGRCGAYPTSVCAQLSIPYYKWSAKNLNNVPSNRDYFALHTRNLDRSLITLRP